MIFTVASFSRIAATASIALNKRNANQKEAWKFIEGSTSEHCREVSEKIAHREFHRFPLKGSVLIIILLYNVSMLRMVAAMTGIY
jgi:hypothetical protein